MAEGEQLITLRKGALREPGKPFQLAHERFFLYPTFDHQPGDLVRESHQPELRRALEEGVWSDGEPLLGAFASGAPGLASLASLASLGAGWPGGVVCWARAPVSKSIRPAQIGRRRDTKQRNRDIGKVFRI